MVLSYDHVFNHNGTETTIIVHKFAEVRSLTSIEIYLKNTSNVSDIQIIWNHLGYTINNLATFLDETVVSMSIFKDSNKYNDNIINNYNCSIINSLLLSDQKQFFFF